MKKNTLHLRRLGIDTYKESVVYMRQDCHVCVAEGFEAQARVKVQLGDRSVIATLNMVHSDILEKGKAGLSEYAWRLLSANEGDEITVTHAMPVESLSDVRAKIYGHTLSAEAFETIIHDITAGRYSDIHISSFLTACAGGRMNEEEIVDLTQAMVDTGDRLTWHSSMVVDKHCVGGLPGNRTTPIVVSIVAAFGLTMPKTSSRSITSPAGTADTMEVLAPVEMDIATMKAVVGKENGCIAWGGAVSLSPADDILIRVEKALELDSEGQLVASVLSKKIAAGSTHVVIDIPIGPTAKVRSREMADLLKHYLQEVGKRLGVTVKVIYTDGTQPVGNGIGPALEARDIVAVLRGDAHAPKDLRERALLLAGNVIEFSPEVSEGKGYAIAKDILESGKAWKKFQAICEAQGGMREIPTSQHTHAYKAEHSGIVTAINTRRIALVARLAGAPNDVVAGIDLHVHIGTRVKAGDTLFTIHSKSVGEMDYALAYLHEGNHIITIEG
jgi:thymidine phosphorylase